MTPAPEFTGALARLLGYPPEPPPWITVARIRVPRSEIPQAPFVPAPRVLLEERPRPTVWLSDVLRIGRRL